MQAQNQTQAKNQALSSQIGSEYILEIIGSENEFKDKKLYFHCLICKKYDFPSKLEGHKISNVHRLRFLEIHYPSLAKAIKTRKLFDSSINTLLACVFKGIFENYHEFEPICPMVSQAHYTENEQTINSAIMNIQRAYNPSAQFVVTMETFIKTEYEAADCEPETIEIPDKSPDKKHPEGIVKTEKNSDGIADWNAEDVMVEKSLSDKEKAALQIAIDRRMKREVSNINMKYAKYQKNLTTCPDYLTDWRDFYFTYSARLASCGVLDEKFYNYSSWFHKHFRKQLDTKKQNEIEKRRKEVEAELSKERKFEKNDHGSDDDSEVKIIEEVPDTYSVSSHDDDDDFDEPAAKKQKRNDECSLDVPQMMRAIRIAHVLIEKGERPTAMGVKRAFNKRPLKEDLESTNDFYNRPNECLIDENSPSLDYFSYAPSLPKSSDLSDRDKFIAARSRLRDSSLGDQDFLILNRKIHALPRMEKQQYESALLQMKIREPYRYNLLSKAMKDDDKN